jgi:hypothetical protein
MRPVKDLGSGSRGLLLAAALISSLANVIMELLMLSLYIVLVRPRFTFCNVEEWPWIEDKWRGRRLRRGLSNATR